MSANTHAKKGGRGALDGAAGGSESPGALDLTEKEKGGGEALRGAPEPVEVTVKQHVPNKRILIVQEPWSGNLAKMRVRDSAHYRAGERVTVRPQPDSWYEPVWHRNRPKVGGMVG